jgi:hypothetical protein
VTLPRLARTVALAVIIAIGIFNVYQAIVGWTLSDAAAYWQAGLRLRGGEELYPALASVDASDVYRYAPWFAWLTVPWTFLPIQVAGALWSLLLLGASALALRPLVAARAWVLVAVFAPILIGISAVGNAHPILIAALSLGVQRRSGPLWIGLAASLKIFPILFAAVYAGRREWGRFVLALGMTALLWAPALLYDLDSYATDPGRAALRAGAPVLYGVVAVAGVVATVLAARSRWAWLTAGVAVCLALPRFFVYDLTYLMVGVAPVRQHRAPASPDAGGPA